MCTALTEDLNPSTCVGSLTTTYISSFRYLLPSSDSSASIRVPATLHCSDHSFSETPFKCGHPSMGIVASHFLRQGLTLTQADLSGIFLLQPPKCWIIGVCHLNLKELPLCRACGEAAVCMFPWVASSYRWVWKLRQLQYTKGWTFLFCSKQPGAIRAAFQPTGLAGTSSKWAPVPKHLSGLFQ